MTRLMTMVTRQMIKFAGLEEVVTITVGEFSATHEALKTTMGVDHIGVSFTVAV